MRQQTPTPPTRSAPDTGGSALSAPVPSPSLSLLCGGDVAPVRQPVDALADHVQPLLDSVDFRFLQCERTYSQRGAFPDWQTIPPGRWSRLDEDYASVFKAAKADVVSLASNHALDFGWDALEDTIALFKGYGMAVVGAGADEDDAHQHVIVEKDGVRVAILAYCSVIRDGQAAIGPHPGVCGLRARTWYEPIDFQPGCPPRIMSEALPGDVARMEADIRAAKKDAHAVVVCLHWGIRYIPKVLATYQTPVAHAAIDAGADVIIGHHPHTIKAVEVYKGKACFYSTGNFLTTGNQGADKTSHAEWNLFWYERDPSSNYGFPDHCREAVLPKLTFSTAGLETVSMHPVYINRQAQPVPVRTGDEGFEKVLTKLNWVSQEFGTEFVTADDEILVKTS
jgi:poly-gamma-glutamate capsule biosynthesis protein CapA/YwtB (metallophosphatase superfamily)